MRVFVLVLTKKGSLLGMLSRRGLWDYAIADVDEGEGSESKLTHKLWAWMTGRMARMSTVIKEGSSREDMMWGRLQGLSHSHWVWVDRQSSTRDIREARPEMSWTEEASCEHRWICHWLHNSGTCVRVRRWNYPEMWKGTERGCKEGKVPCSHLRK